MSFVCRRIYVNKINLILFDGPMRRAYSKGFLVVFSCDLKIIKKVIAQYKNSGMLLAVISAADS